MTDKPESAPHARKEREREKKTALEQTLRPTAAEMAEFDRAVGFKESSPVEIQRMARELVLEGAKLLPRLKLSRFSEMVPGSLESFASFFRKAGAAGFLDFPPARPEGHSLSPLEVVKVAERAEEGDNFGLFRLPHGHPRHPDTRYEAGNLGAIETPGYVIHRDLEEADDELRSWERQNKAPARFVPTKDDREAVFTPTPPGYVVGVDFAAKMDEGEAVAVEVVETWDRETGKATRTITPQRDIKTVYADAWDAHDPVKGTPVRRMSREEAEAIFPRGPGDDPRLHRTEGGEFSMPEADAELAKQDPEPR